VSRRQYAIHRWLGAIIGVQLFLWCLGGFVFAIHDMEHVRGRTGMSSAPPPALATHEVALTPAEAAAKAGASGDAMSIELRPLLDRPVYEVRTAGDTTLIDAATGEVLSPIVEAKAVALARADREGEPVVRRVSLVEAEPPIEYRSGPLPAWRVELDDGHGTHLWIAAESGRVTARRNDAWRRFDFFWMLHTMDYRGRDDFSHPILIAFAALSLITVGTGGVLWGLRIRRRLVRRRRDARRQSSQAPDAQR
jgi:hypothetical protein